LNIIEHGGSINGFNSLVLRITNSKDLIVLLNNTGNTSLNEISDEIIDILYEQPYDMPEKPLLQSFTEIMNEKGIDAANDFYNKKIEEGEKIPEGSMNMLGYSYLGKKQYKDAIDIFKLNVKAYPQSYNVYDSYAEALMMNGDKGDAITNYIKSVELNPNNNNGIKKLQELGVEISLPVEVKVDPEVYDLLAGKYELNPQFIFTITKEDDKIFVHATGQQKVEIYPTSELEYYLKVVNAQITFAKDENGKIEKLILHQNGQNMPAKKIE